MASRVLHPIETTLLNQAIYLGEAIYCCIAFLMQSQCDTAICEGRPEIGALVSFNLVTSVKAREAQLGIKLKINLVNLYLL